MQDDGIRGSVTIPIEYKVEVRRMWEEDVSRVAEIAAGEFSGFRAEENSSPSEGSYTWIRAKMRSYPVDQYYVITVDGRVHGYVLWAFRAGPHAKFAVAELEQIATSKWSREKNIGLGTKLEEQSIKLLRQEVEEKQIFGKGQRLSRGYLFTDRRTGAQPFYEKILGAVIVATAPEIFRDGRDQTLMQFSFERRLRREKRVA